MSVHQRADEALAVFASVTRLHIVAIASVGTLTFGWIFTGHWLLLLAGISALDWFLVNLLNRVVDFEEDQANAVTGTEFVARHRRALVWSGFAVLGASLVAGLWWVPWIAPLRVGYHSLGLLYNWPLLPGRRRIKQLYFWKNTASAVGFMLTVFGYPLVFAHRHGSGLRADMSWGAVWWLAVFFFLFELSYEVIYDLRDAPGDEAAGVMTYVVVHGERGAGWIVQGLVLVSSVALVGGYLFGGVPWRGVVMVVAPVIQVVFYKRIMKRGITSTDCVALTWLGAGLLAMYDAWALLRLPGV